MPIYPMENEAGETMDAFYTMAEAPRIGQEIEIDGQKWRRILTKPNASVTSITTADPYSAKAFNASLDGKKVTVGDMWDASKEASEKRAAKDGVDPVKQAYYKDYSKERRGLQHKGQQKESAEKNMKEFASTAKKLLQ